MSDALAFVNGVALVLRPSMVFGASRGLFLPSVLPQTDRSPALSVILGSSRSGVICWWWPLQGRL